MGTQIEATSEQLEMAIETFRGQWGRLFQDSGLPKYMPDEQQRRQEMAHNALSAAVARANALADEELDAVTTIERPMQSLGDPIMALLPVELSRASSLLPFATADIGDLNTPVGQLAAKQRCREAMASGDRAMAAVYLKVIRDQDGFEAEADALAAIVWPDVVADKKKLAARRSSAQALKTAALNANLMAKQGGRTVGSLREYSLATGPYSGGKL